MLVVCVGGIAVGLLGKCRPGASSELLTNSLSWKTTQHWSGHQCIVKFQEMCIPSECIRSTPKAAEQIRLARTTGARQTSTADNSLGSTFHLRSWYQFTRLTWEGEGGGPADRAPGAGALCSGGGGSLHSSSGRHKPSNGLSTQPSPRS